MIIPVPLPTAESRSPPAFSVGRQFPPISSIIIDSMSAGRISNVPSRRGSRAAQQTLPNLPRRFGFEPSVHRRFTSTTSTSADSDPSMSIPRRALRVSVAEISRSAPATAIDLASDLGQLQSRTAPPERPGNQCRRRSPSRCLQRGQGHPPSPPTEFILIASAARSSDRSSRAPARRFA